MSTALLQVVHSCLRVPACTVQHCCDGQSLMLQVCDKIDLLVALRSIACIGMQQRQQQRQEPPIEHSLPCTLEELYKGNTRKMKISRTVHNAAGRPERISEILTIEIKPGWKKGTRITFPEKGKHSNARYCRACLTHHMHTCTRLMWIS